MSDTSVLVELARTVGQQVKRIAPMPGGASTRQYFRVWMVDGRSAVGMFVPDGDRPDEATNAAAAGRWPFLEVRDLLASRGVRVPVLFAEDARRGWLLLEDLGDETLAARIAAHPGERTTLYAIAVQDLAKAHARLAELPEGSVVARRAFDAELLEWELQHFREWALDAQGNSLGPDDRAEFDALAHALAQRIAAWPRGFTHRDYQSRNLMVKGGALVWIDFQDALLGPRAYDLVALLADSYQELDRAFVLARIGEYARAAGFSPEQRGALEREVDVITVQRKLKDAGRFVFIDRVKKNPSFLPFIEPSLRKVKGALERLEGDDPEMRDLARILRRALPEVMAA